MNDNVFLDTNIIVLSYSFVEIEKQQIARKLIADSNSYISTQVLQELANILTRKFSFSYSEALLALEESRNNNILHTNTESTIVQACEIAERYRFSFYDSLIIAAALECECTILYSEDMSHGQLIEEQLRISNPFR